VGGPRPGPGGSFSAEAQICRRLFGLGLDESVGNGDTLLREPDACTLIKADLKRGRLSSSLRDQTSVEQPLTRPTDRGLRAAVSPLSDVFNREGERIDGATDGKTDDVAQQLGQLTG
jgi:hypothetical protein